MFTYSKKGQYDLAISDFTKSLDINPNASRVLYNRGITYAIRGQFDLALLDLNRSLQIKSTSGEVYDIREASMWSWRAQIGDKHAN